MRWVTLLGRMGTVLLVIGLALALVSLVPPAPAGHMSSSGFTLSPKKYHIHWRTGVYSPQNGIQVSVTSNNSLHLYLFDVHYFELGEWARSWVTERFPDLNESEIWRGMHNTSVLKGVVQAHQENVLLKSTVDGKWSQDFFPTRVANVTLAVSNPSLNLVEVEIEIRGITALAPRERVLTPAQWLVPIGLVLALPWAYIRTKKAPTR